MGHKKRKTNFKRKSILSKLKPEEVKTAKSSKRQDMVFNDEMAGDTPNEGPVGKAEAGIEGLGGDMHGYPTGMGAGAEPLGAFENENTPSINNADPQQSLDDKSDSFAPQGRPYAESEQNDQESGPSQNEPMKMKAGGPKAPAVSMSNSLDNVDSSVNVQGDGEIGNYIRNAQKSKSPGAQDKDEPINEMIGLESNDPPFTGPGGPGPDSAGNMDGGDNLDEEAQREEKTGSKRRLVKQERKEKKKAKNHHATWKKPFKVLQN